MEDILASVQRKHGNKVADLQTTVDRLLQVGFSHTAQISIVFFFLVVRLYEDVTMFFDAVQLHLSFLGNPQLQHTEVSHNSPTN